MSGYLLDTNIVSELRKGRRANQAVVAWAESIVEEPAFLSVLTLGEIRCGVERIRGRDQAQAKNLDNWLVELEQQFGERILQIDGPIAFRWGRLQAIQPISVIDGLLAATALEKDLTLATRNVQDVARTGVRVLDPFLEPR